MRPGRETAPGFFMQRRGNSEAYCADAAPNEPNFARRQGSTEPCNLLAADQTRPTSAHWSRTMYSRLSGLPSTTTPLFRPLLSHCYPLFLRGGVLAILQALSRRWKIRHCNFRMHFFPHCFFRFGGRASTKSHAFYYGGNQPAAARCRRRNPPLR